MTSQKRFVVRHKRFFTGALIVAGILICIIALNIFVIIGFSQFEFNPDDYKTNLYTEVFGVLFSVFVSVVIIGGWSYWRETQQLKARLKREAGSRSNDIAISAVEWLREKKWLIGEKGILRKADLVNANLKEADLSFANLQGATLIGTKLQKSVLSGARLEEACLFAADLQEAQLSGARLRGVTFSRANLRGAGLSDAELQNAKLDGTDLLGADLSEANLNGATFRSESDYAREQYTEGFIGIPPPTILPDGTMFSESMDLKRFTDPTHAKYNESLRTINEVREGLGFELLEYFNLPPSSEYDTPFDINM